MIMLSIKFSANYRIIILQYTIQIIRSVKRDFIIFFEIRMLLNKMYVIQWNHILNTRFKYFANLHINNGHRFYNNYTDQYKRHLYNILNFIVSENNVFFSLKSVHIILNMKLNTERNVFQKIETKTNIDNMIQISLKPWHELEGVFPLYTTLLLSTPTHIFLTVLKLLNKLLLFFCYTDSFIENDVSLYL